MSGRRLSKGSGSVIRTYGAGFVALQHCRRQRRLGGRIDGRIVQRRAIRRGLRRQDRQRRRLVDVHRRQAYPIASVQRARLRRQGIAVTKAERLVNHQMRRGRRMGMFAGHGRRRGDRRRQRQRGGRGGIVGRSLRERRLAPRVGYFDISRRQHLGQQRPAGVVGEGEGRGVGVLLVVGRRLVRVAGRRRSRRRGRETVRNRRDARPGAAGQKDNEAPQRQGEQPRGRTAAHHRISPQTSLQKTTSPLTSAAGPR